MELSHAKPYKIQAQPIPERYARGWHCLGLASDYTEAPVALNYFGTRLVAFRGEDNQVHVLDGYCPHLGADLANGCVEGNSIRCRFHNWRWGPDGLCNDIPYAARIPKKAVIKAWPVMEENHLLFIWHDPEENPPIPEQAPPRIEDCFSEQWTHWHVEKMKIHNNCRELVDNHADAAHFGPVHGANATRFKNIIEGHVFIQQMGNLSPLLAGENELFSEAIYCGPAYMTSLMTGSMDGIDIVSRLLVAHVPIDLNSFDLFFGVMIKKNATMSDAENAVMVERYVEASRIAFFQDVAIWKDKIRIDNPILCDGDGPVAAIRQWYNQFYQDIADVSPRWKTRSEIVIL